jgi:hypothetical protein
VRVFGFNFEGILILCEYNIEELIVVDEAKVFAGENYC